MKHYLVSFLVILCALTGCKNKQPDIITYDLQIKSFVEKIYGSGTLESANNFTIVAPTLMSSSVKVSTLAPEGSFVQKGDTVCTLVSTDIQGFYDRYYDELLVTKGELTKQESNNAIQLSLLNSQILENQARMSISQLDSAQLKFAPPVQKRLMELELKKNYILEEKLLKKQRAEKKINEQTVRALKSQVIQKEQLVQRFQDQLDMLIIIAPKEGMVVYPISPTMMFFSGSGEIETQGGTKIAIGSTVNRRMPLIELPDLNAMQVKLMVPEGDLKRIEKGQLVIIKPDAVPDLVTTGTVSNISLGGKQMDYKFKVKTYKITIKIDSLDNQMLPGLSANCELVVNDIQDTIVVPSMSIFERDSLKIVYVSQGDFFTAEPVETGLSNRAHTIISKGLKGTETIALIEPPSKLIHQPKNKINE